MKWQDLCDGVFCYLVEFICWVYDKLDPWHSEDKGMFRDTDQYNMMSPKEVREMLREQEEAKSEYTFISSP